MCRLLLGFVPFFIGSFLEARNFIPEFQTTRLQSTAGAGVASLLMDEATVLNPAPVSLFKNGSLYYSRNMSDSTRTQDSEAIENRTNAFIVSDTSSIIKGSFRYLDQTYRDSSRKEYALAAGSPIGKSSSMGISYIRGEEEFVTNDQIVEFEYNVMNIGFLHALNEKFTMGLLVTDPLEEIENNTKAIVGLQYVFKDFLAIMLDSGADYRENLSDTILWRAAAQFKVYQDFYVRAGTFNDKGSSSRGNGAGIAWMGPKVVAELALKNTKFEENVDIALVDEELRELSFSFAYKF